MSLIKLYINGWKQSSISSTFPKFTFFYVPILYLPCETQACNWRRKGWCLECGLIRNHCLCPIFNFACFQREWKRDHIGKRVFGINEVWSKIITSSLPFSLISDLFSYTYLITSCMGYWDWSRTRLHSSHLPFSCRSNQISRSQR